MREVLQPGYIRTALRQGLTIAASCSFMPKNAAFQSIAVIGIGVALLIAAGGDRIVFLDPALAD